MIFLQQQHFQQLNQYRYLQQQQQQIQPINYIINIKSQNPVTNTVSIEQLIVRAANCNTTTYGKYIAITTIPNQENQIVNRTKLAERSANQIANHNTGNDMNGLTSGHTTNRSDSPQTPQTRTTY